MQATDFGWNSERTRGLSLAFDAATYCAANAFASAGEGGSCASARPLGPAARMRIARIIERTGVVSWFAALAGSFIPDHRTMGGDVQFSRSSTSHKSNAPRAGAIVRVDN